MIGLKLDTPAVNALFAGQEARVELQQAVVAEICRRLFDKYVINDVTALIGSIFAAHKDELVRAIRDDQAFRKSIEEKFTAEIAKISKDAWGKSTTVKVKPEVAAEVDKIVQASVNAALKERGLLADQLINQAIDGAVNRLTERALNRIDHAVTTRVEKNVNEEIERRVRAALSKALQST